MKDKEKQPKWMEDSLRLLDEFYAKMTEEEKNDLVERINAMGFHGPTVEEYFESVNFKPDKN